MYRFHIGYITKVFLSLLFSGSDIFYLCKRILHTVLSDGIVCTLPVGILEELLHLLQLPGFLAAGGDQLAQVLDFLKDPLKQARVFLGKVLYESFVGKQIIADQIRHHFSFDLGGCFLPGIALFPLVQLRQLLKSGLVDSLGVAPGLHCFLQAIV